MATRPRLTLPVLEPALQVSFYYRLQAIRDQCLHEAMRAAVDRADLGCVDRELAEFVSPEGLRKAAHFGLRGEVFFAVPSLLEAKPNLLGYYRLLLGHSQKEFYSKGPFGRFKRMEEAGDLPVARHAELAALCKSLVGAAEVLVEAIESLSLDTVHELQLLTLGPQMRGGENTRLGQKATEQVFELIKSIVHRYLKEATKRTLILRNESGRTAVVEFASDPDVRIYEKLQSGVRPVVSIEVKGGGDVSNVHNRLGEAEKSHQKARAKGYFEFWTILRARGRGCGREGIAHHEPLLQPRRRAAGEEQGGQGIPGEAVLPYGNSRALDFKQERPQTFTHAFALTDSRARSISFWT